MLLFPGVTKQPENTKMHVCSVCGKPSTWGDTWAWRFIIHDVDLSVGDPGWEETFKTCSEKCRENTGKHKVIQ